MAIAPNFKLGRVPKTRFIALGNRTSYVIVIARIGRKLVPFWTRILTRLSRQWSPYFCLENFVSEEETG